MEVYKILMRAFAPTPQALDPSMIIIEEKTTQIKQKKLCDDLTILKPQNFYI